MTEWEGLPYHRMPALGFDLETTHREPHQARIVSVGRVWDDGKGTVGVLEQIVQQDGPIPPEATAIHGITDERAATEGYGAAKLLDYVAQDLAYQMRMGLPVVAFNASYDLTVIQCELARHGLPSLTDRLPLQEWFVIDPHVIDKAIDRYRPGARTLTATAEHYGFTLAGAHTASADAVAALAIMRAQPDREAKLLTGAADRIQMMEWQAAWRRTQSASLAEHFAKQGNPQHVEAGWPLQNPQNGATT